MNIIQGASFYLVGLPDSAVKESQFRIESTFKSNDFRMPGRRVIVNMAPADLKKEGSAYDLSFVSGLMAVELTLQNILYLYDHKFFNII
jgi:magnesium chelatase family protein